MEDERYANQQQAEDNLAQKQNNTEQAASNEAQRKTHRKQRKIDYVQTGVYIFLAFVVCLAFYLNDQNSKKDLIRLCEAGTDSRNVQRSLVNEIYNLNLGLIDPNQEYTKEEQKRIKSFVRDVTEFRARSYKELKPSEVCAPYVTDTNVTPPDTKLPQIKSKGVGNN